LNLMLSVGHRTGLFDAMAGMTPASSADIAKRAGLQERYVREWLGAMTVSKVVDHDGNAGTYVLPLTLVGAFAPGLRVLAPVLRDVTQFVWRVTRNSHRARTCRKRLVSDRACQSGQRR
jgi:DNA-binding IclR family transcriptional regulator